MRILFFSENKQSRKSCFYSTGTTAPEVGNRLHVGLNNCCCRWNKSPTEYLHTCMKLHEFTHRITVVEQGNYHVIVVIECSGVQHPINFHDINSVYSVQNIRVSSIMKLTM